MEGLARQVFVILVLALCYMDFGSNESFPSVIISDIEKYHSNIYGKAITLSDTQKDMLGSFLGLGAIIATVSLPFTSLVLGKKALIQIGAILSFCSWIGVSFLPSAWGIIALRIVSGMYLGTVAIVGSNFCIEISSSNLRGIFSGLLRVFIVSGQLMMTVVGYWFHYYHVSLISAVVPGLVIAGMLFVPESPRYLVVKGKDSEAKKVLTSLRSRNADIEQELQMYREMNEERETRSVWKGLRQPIIVKRLLTVIVLFFIRGFGGFEVLVTYFIRIFQSFGTDINENLASIILFAVQIPSTLVFSFLFVDRIGRRKTLFVSCTIISLSLLYLAVHSYLQRQLIKDAVAVKHLNIGNATTYENFYSSIPSDKQLGTAIWNYLPVVSACLCLAGFYMGLQTIPFILMAELFPTWLRAQATAICGLFYTFFQFSALQLFTPMMRFLTPSGYYLFMSALIAWGIPFTYFFIEESMGKEIG